MNPGSEGDLREALAEYWNRESRGAEWPSAAIDLLSTLMGRPKKRSPGFTLRGEYFDIITLEYNWGDQTVKFIWIPGDEVKLNESNANLLEVFKQSELGRHNIYVIMTESLNELANEAKECREGGYNVLLASPNDIDNIADGSWNPNELLTFKISRVVIQGLSDRDAVFDEETFSKIEDLVEPSQTQLDSYRLSSKLQNLDADNHPRKSITHPLEDDIREEVIDDASSAIFIHGPSSSGKTSLVLNVGYSLFTGEDWDGTILYIDVSKVNERDIIQLSTLLVQMESAGDELMMIADDLQANPKLSEQIISLSDFLRSNHPNGEINFVGITWPSYWEELNTSDIVSQYTDYNVKPEQIKDLIINRRAEAVTDELLAKAEEVSNDDLLILERMISWLSDIDHKPNAESLDTEFARSIWEEEFETVIDQGLKSAVLLVSCLGRYEIAVDPDFIFRNTDVSESDLRKLINEKLLREKSGRVTLGHRSYCQLLFDFLVSESDTLSQLEKHGIESPRDIVLDYVASLTPEEIWPILKSIQTHAGFQSEDTVTQHQDIVINTWKTIDYLAKKVIEQQTNDPTWNRTPSSAQFAIQSLKAIGENNLAKQSLEFLRSTYQAGVEKDHLDIDISSLETTKDFNKIKYEMMAEDHLHSPCCERATEIDEDQFHANWARGVILCAEAYSGDLSMDQLTELAKCVESHMEDGGYYYPQRVPWCTARVLIGLALCGRTVENSQTVEKLAETLLSHPSYSDGRWESGTGNWNTWIEATALSVIGLIMAGIDKEHNQYKKVQEAITTLYQAREQWIHEDNLLDGVVALRAYSLVSQDLHPVAEEVKSLSEQVREEALWINPTADADEIFDQSCLVAQAAAGLMTTMLEFLQQDLPILLNKFDIETERERKKTIDCFISYSWDSSDHEKWVHDLADDLDECGFNVEIDKTGLRPADDLPQYMEKAVETCDCAIVIGTPEYADKANERKGGVGYEFKMIAGRLLDDDDDFICFPLVVRGDRKEAIPRPLKTDLVMDFREDAKYEENLERLAEAISDKASNS